ncbi:MAG: peptidoglycan-binding domain-containing protein [bacterium]|nr:peptidoglycan-binding domain-containing protein [bacterium]
MLKRILLLFFLILIFAPAFVFADYLDQKKDFFIESSFDKTGREKIEGVLKKLTPRIYFYVDSKWWGDLTAEQQKKNEEVLEKLGAEFHAKIYPELTKEFGTEWKPGIDNDSMIYVLYCPMKDNVGGYFREKDEQLRTFVKDSNQAEIVFLNSDFIDSKLNSSFLAHEFEHLIDFYQKQKILGLSEETWLIEARNEYAPTLLGYDNDYQGSSFQGAVKSFLNNPRDSITEWQNKPSDYGALSVFIHYLVEHYGIGVLSESLKINKIGIPSINEVLRARNFKKDFGDIFSDWAVASYVNDCSLGEEYCYLNENLKNFRISPTINLIPLTGASTLAVTDTIKPWSAHWIKFIAGEGKLRLTFIGNPENLFKVPFVLQKTDNSYEVGHLKLDNNQRAELDIVGFGNKYKSLAIIPSLQSKLAGFNGEEAAFSYFWSVSLEKEETRLVASSDMAKLKKLLEEINKLEMKIKQLKKTLLAMIEMGAGKETTCGQFSNDLSMGLINNGEVRCLQQFLKNQSKEIYPAGLITGNFSNLTLEAVKKYQAGKNLPITGNFDSLTREKANSELK